MIETRLFLEPPDDLEDHHGFLMGQRRRRLVKDHDRGVAGEGTRDLDDALLGDGEPLHRQRNIDAAETEFIE